MKSPRNPNQSPSEQLKQAAIALLFFSLVLGVPFLQLHAKRKGAEAMKPCVKQAVQERFNRNRKVGLSNFDEIFDLCVSQVMEGEAPADYPAD
jgi:hypothetical protein